MILNQTTVQYSGRSQTPTTDNNAGSMRGVESQGSGITVDVSLKNASHFGRSYAYWQTDALQQRSRYQCVVKKMVVSSTGAYW